MPDILPNLESTRRRSRLAPLRSLTAQRLVSALDAFEAGDLREAAILWTAMAQRDDMISAVKAKREKAVANRDWQILTSEETPAATAHKERLEWFWNNVTAVNAFDRNEKGGVARLIRQMMEATSFAYAAHHIQWSPTGEGLTATFEYVPLWFFENRSGELRFIKDGMAYTGEDLAPGEWMVTCGDGVMKAASLCYFGKREGLTDWLIYNSKFGIPGVLGRTNQGEDTDGGRAMADAVAAFSNDWEAVIYGDDSSGKIEIVSAGGGNSLPFPELIDRVDRRIAALYRGADLSTSSAGAGSGQGASIQGGESDLIESDDARMISETLQGVERRVIEYYFGAGVKPLAYFQVILPEAQDLKMKMDAVKLLHELKVPLSVPDLRETFGVAEPGDGEQQVGGQTETDPATKLSAEDLTQINAAAETLLKAMQAA